MRPSVKIVELDGTEIEREMNDAEYEVFLNTWIRNKDHKIEFNILRLLEITQFIKDNKIL